MTLRCFSEKELAGCGGITLPFRDWSEGTQLDHPKYSRGKLWSRDNDGRMIFEFPDNESAFGLDVEYVLTNDELAAAIEYATERACPSIDGVLSGMVERYQQHLEALLEIQLNRGYLVRAK